MVFTNFTDCISKTSTRGT